MQTLEGCRLGMGPTPPSRWLVSSRYTLGHAAAKPRRTGSAMPTRRPCWHVLPPALLAPCARRKKGAGLAADPPRRALAGSGTTAAAASPFPARFRRPARRPRGSEEPRVRSACSVARSAVRSAPEGASPHRPDHGGLVPRSPFGPKTDRPARTVRSSAGLPSLAAPLPFLRTACAFEFRPPCLTTPSHRLRHRKQPLRRYIGSVCLAAARRLARFRKAVAQALGPLTFRRSGVLPARAIGSFLAASAAGTPRSPASRHLPTFERSHGIRVGPTIFAGRDLWITWIVLAHERDVVWCSCNPSREQDVTQPYRSPHGSLYHA